MANPMMGTAHLFGVLSDRDSRALIAAAAAAGLRRVDTAPSYGHGSAEAVVGSFVAESGRDAWTVTTKVGIQPVDRPGRAVRVAKSAARRLPGPVRRRLRGDRPPGGGAFDVPDVRASIARSVQRLGFVDRLLLHEARPDDLGSELLDVLRAEMADGRVRAVGLATANALTPACLALGPDLFSVVHLAVGARAAVPPLPGRPLIVGHGVFGAAGADLAVLRSRLERGDAWASQWRDAVAGTPWAGAPRDETSGLADAVVALATARTVAAVDGAALPVSDVIVASSDAARLIRTAELVASAPAVDPAVAALLVEGMAG